MGQRRECGLPSKRRFSNRHYRSRIPGEGPVSSFSLAPNLVFKNSLYFEAPYPRKLGKEAVIEAEINLLSFFCADGFMSGQVWMQLIGFDTFEGSRVGTYHSNHAYVMRRTRASSSEARELKAGTCGSPIVHQERDDDVIGNLCVGFFSAFDGANIVAPTVDYLSHR